MCDVRGTVAVAGEVERPLTLDLRDLADLAAEQVTVDFHCHEGWSRLGQSYCGVALATLLGPRWGAARRALRDGRLGRVQHRAYS